MSRKTALVMGATRGIGRQVALAFAEKGYRVCVTGKTVCSTEKTPGSIYDIADEINEVGGEAFPLRCNVRYDPDIMRVVNSSVKKFGGLDVAVYNAGAVDWKEVHETPMKRWDLMNQVNCRGAYSMVHHLLPHMMNRNHGRMILVAPPIYNRFFKGKTPYSMSKCAMTILVHGLANELDTTDISISALWPATVIESQVTKMRKLPPSFMRKASIFAEACVKIAEEETTRLNGQALIDEDYLRSLGVEDFIKYRADPDQEPSRMMPKKFPSLLVDEELSDPPFRSNLSAIVASKFAKPLTSSQQLAPRRAPQPFPLNNIEVDPLAQLNANRCCENHDCEGHHTSSSDKDSEE